MITYDNKIDIKRISTAELVEELTLRLGVQTASVPPYEPYSVSIGQNTVYDSGPAYILVIKD